jgi:hypothetical protein
MLPDSNVYAVLLSYPDGSGETRVAGVFSSHEEAEYCAEMLEEASPAKTVSIQEGVPYWGKDE